MRANAQRANVVVFSVACVSFETQTPTGRAMHIMELTVS